MVTNSKFCKEQEMIANVLCILEFFFVFDINNFFCNSIKIKIYEKDHSTILMFEQAFQI